MVYLAVKDSMLPAFVQDSRELVLVGSEEQISEAQGPAKEGSCVTATPLMLAPDKLQLWKCRAELLSLVHQYTVHALLCQHDL